MSHPTCLDETWITQPITEQTSLSQAWWIPLIDFCPNFQKKSWLSVLHIGPDICCRNKSWFSKSRTSISHRRSTHDSNIPSHCFHHGWWRSSFVDADFLLLLTTPLFPDDDLLEFIFNFEVFFFLPVAVSAKKNKDTAFPSHTSHVWMNMFWMKKLGFLPNPWAKDMTGNGWKLGWSHCLDSEAKML